MTADLADARYVSFVSRRADGSTVATPVWIVPFGNGWAFTTDSRSHKVARISRDPRVSIAVCSYRGHVAEGAIVHHGTATVLDPAATARVTALVKKKYRLGWGMLILYERLKSLRGGSPEVDTDCAIGVHLD
ncbi:MAG: hypothetical protein RL330_825 [Actinomycetota bacterium]|jgi:PPOX class probable F420-dependent enzyme